MAKVDYGGFASSVSPVGQDGLPEQMEETLSPKMTKKRAVEIALNPAEFSLPQLRQAHARLGESLAKGTPGGFPEHMYIQDRVRDLDQAIASREAVGTEGE